MTINDILNIMEGDQPIQIIRVGHDWHEKVVYEGCVEDMDESDVWDEWEPVKILTPSDNDGTIRFVC